MKTKLLLMLVAIALAAGAAQAELVVNGDFEGGVTSGGMAVGWFAGWGTTYNSWTSVHRVESPGGVGGGAFLFLRNYTTSVYSGGVAQMVQGVVAGEEYSFSVWGKQVNPGDNIPAWGYIDWIDSKGAAIGGYGVNGWLGSSYSTASGYSVPGDDWTEINWGLGGSAEPITAPPGATQIEFGLWCVDPNGVHLDNASVTIVNDNVPPTLGPADIVDNIDGEPAEQYHAVPYTVTFDDYMDETTITADDFENVGSATVSIGTVTLGDIWREVFSVPVTATSLGTIQLQVKSGVEIKDSSGNSLDTGSAIVDPNIITVIDDTTAPTLAPADIVDGMSGQDFTAGSLVTYMVTFSEDMDATTVNAGDFSNAGTVTISVGAITETSAVGFPSVFTVEVTPITVGTLQLQVDGPMTDVKGLALAGVPIVDDTTINVLQPVTSNAVIYEPFFYPLASGNPDSLDGNSGPFEKGFAAGSAWDAYNVDGDGRETRITADYTGLVPGSLSWGALPVLGNQAAGGFNYGRMGGTREISTAALADNGLLDDGATVWFSVLFKRGVVRYSATFAMALGDSGFDPVVHATSGSFSLQNGYGIGVYVEENRVKAVWFKPDGNPVTGGVTPPHYAENETRLLVGKITWGTTPMNADTIEIYEPGEDLVLPDAPVSTVANPLDQSAFDTLTFRWRDAVYMDEFRFGPDYESVIESHSFNISPAHGAKIKPASELELSWTNMDPNNPPIPSVWVDVWFGTDPNDYNDYNKIVDANENTSSVTVDASVEGTYYWQVDSYIYGDPAVVIYDDNDLNPDSYPVIESQMFVFHVVPDFPPAVYAGVDMITWSGKKVELAATPYDDGESALSYVWSAVPFDPNTTVVFEPAVNPANPNTSNAADPNIIITKIPGVAGIVIINAGFEDPILADGSYVYNLGDFWRDGYYWGSDWYDDDYYAGIENPATEFGGIVPEGENAAFQWSYAGYDMGLRQILAATLQADTHYELSVMAGSPDGSSYFPPATYRIELLAGGVVRDANSVPSPAPGTWTKNPVTATYNSPSTVAEGKALEIRIVLEDDGTTDALLYFDDVRLTATGPMHPTVVTLTATVSDAVGSAEDSMTIDVYDNSCLASAVGVLGTVVPADYDEDCDTDLEDFAVIATAWLDGSELDDLVEMASKWLIEVEPLTEPVAKP